MDFRGVRIDELRWSKTARGAGVVGPGGAKVQVQTPVAACRMVPMVSKFSSGWTLDLTFQDSDPVAAAFADFLEDTMAAAVAWGGVTGVQPADAVTRSFGGGRSLRVTAFSDTLFFDPSGAVTLPSGGAQSLGASCLLELQGLWTSPARWGLRWRVVQVKEAPNAPAAAPSFAFLDD